MRSVRELPRWDALPGDARRCLAQIDDWAMCLRDSAVVALFSESAGHGMTAARGAELLDALEGFVGEHWDFRHGRERNLAIEPEFSQEQVVAIAAAAEDLGLVGTLPPRRRHYDAIIMTGGMVRAGIVKPRFARALYERGVDWNEAVFLGGFREFAGDEVSLGPLLGVTGSNEFDAMTAGMRFAFDLGDPDSVESSPGAAAGSDVRRVGNAHWREDSWSWNDRTLRVVAAPSSAPELRRANTVDTYRFWAARAEGIRSVLIVTTPVYVPYQAAGAVEVLGLESGFSVETVAVSDAASDLGEHTQVFLPMHYAQELRSAVHGFRQLRRRLAG